MTTMQIHMLRQSTSLVHQPWNLILGFARLVSDHRFIVGKLIHNLTQKITDLGDLTINTLELWLVAQKLLKFITESEHRMPRELRKIIQRVDEEVKITSFLQAKRLSLQGS